MTIYKKKRTTVNYRKIYEQNFGPIPKDENGRTYEIHHIDGDDSNNDSTNLVALSIIDHFQLHKSQGDWAACLLISKSMSVSPEEKSELARLEANRRVEDGTNPFQRRSDGTSLASDRVKNGTHHFMGEAGSNLAKETSSRLLAEGKHNFQGGDLQQKRLADGTHHFLGDSNPSVQRSKNGTHHFFGGEQQRQMNKKLLDAGTHSTQWPWTCGCGREGKGKSNLVQHQRSNKCSLNNN